MKQTIIEELKIDGQPSSITRLSCLDSDVQYFERQYPVPDGMSYNSHLLIDQKVVLFDTVDANLSTEWYEALELTLKEAGDRSPDYLIVQHLEPDHSSCIGMLMERFQACTLLCSAKAAGMLPNFCPGLDMTRVQSVAEGERLSTGSHELQFFMAPMVHWPEVLVVYDLTTDIMFSADAFGTFGTHVASLQPDSPELPSLWTAEARRYYYNICGKYGVQVKALLHKMTKLPIRLIAPLHGPAIDLRTFNAIEPYMRWSQWQPDFPDGCMVAVASMYGNTLEGARRLADNLRQCGVPVKLHDLMTADLSEVTADAFAFGSSAFFCATYDGALMPAMRSLLSRLKAKGWQNRPVALGQNGSWAPVAARLMLKELEEMKGIEVVQPTVTIRTRLNDASSESIDELAHNLTAKLRGE